MKIIGVSSVYDGNYRFIIEADRRELERITGLSSRDISKAEPHFQMDVCKVWDDAMACRKACEEAVKLPATLRATADCMEMVAERARAVAEATRPADTETATP
jgi:hypothetical protein